MESQTGRRLLQPEGRGRVMKIDVDDALVTAAMAVAGLSTEDAVVEDALRRLIRLKREERTLALYGTVDWEGDLEESRL